MGHSQAEKAKTHEQILKLAAAHIRERGLEALGVVQLMKDVGLTHGGFYVHFPSREALLEEALDRALEAGLGPEKSPRVLSTAAFVKAYLSPEHRDEPASGCAMSAVTGDIRNSTPKAKGILTKHLKRRLQLMTDKLGGTEADREKALAATSTLIGAVMLARAVDDAQLSDEILRSARRTLVGSLEDEGSPPRRKKRAR
jgi:TetR/AcrR family transcriptional regulator, transcriptional repressor for nem operon